MSDESKTMAEFKGTPGPWKLTEGPAVAKGGVAFSINGPTGQFLTDMEGSDDAGHRERGWLPTAEVAANARLFAAAPDLLASLEESLLANAALMNAIARSGHAEAVMNAMDTEIETRVAGFGVRARAAVARAKGE